MGIDVHSVGSHVAGLAWVALRSFTGTVIVLVLVGGAFAGLSYYFLREHHGVYGLMAVALALCESLAMGIFLGAKRALAAAAAYGIGKLRLGGSLVRLVFERMLGILGEEEPANQGARIARQLEQLPLAQADDLLSNAIRDMTGKAEEAGWLRRKLQAHLLEAVRKYTLARFREEGAKHGGINLLKLKEELEQTVDDALVRKVLTGVRLWTAFAIMGLALVVAGQTWIIVALLRVPG